MKNDNAIIQVRDLIAGYDDTVILENITFMHIKADILKNHRVIKADILKNRRL